MVASKAMMRYMRKMVNILWYMACMEIFRLFLFFSRSIRMYPFIQLFIHTSILWFGRWSESAEIVICGIWNLHNYNSHHELCVKWVIGECHKVNSNSIYKSISCMHRISTIQLKFIHPSLPSKPPWVGEFCGH